VDQPIDSSKLKNIFKQKQQPEESEEEGEE